MENNPHDSGPVKQLCNSGYAAPASSGTAYNAACPYGIGVNRELKQPVRQRHEGLRMLVQNRLIDRIACIEPAGQGAEGRHDEFAPVMQEATPPHMATPTLYLQLPTTK